MGQPYALVKLASLYEQSGDCFAAERLAGDYERIFPSEAGEAGWREIAKVRQERGDVASAEALLWRLVVAGDNHALALIADLRLKIGDSGVSTAKKSLATVRLSRIHQKIQPPPDLALLISGLPGFC